jgi:hypothetical protein
MVLLAAGTWLIGCGDDAKPGAPPRGKGGSAGMAGSSGAPAGGTGGTAGTSTGGTAGSTGGTVAGTAGTATAGTAGTGAGTGGSAGSAGNGMGGEGGDNQAGGGGTAGSSAGTAGADQGGQGGEGGGGGEGGASASMCTTANLDVTLVSATGTQRHDHLPINGAFRTTLLAMINTGSPLVYTLPPEGMNVHDHTLTFTAGQLTTLRNGGSLQANVTTSTGGPQNNRHTHTYAITCAP